MLCNLATGLGPIEMGEINELEAELGHALLAYNWCPGKPAELSHKEVDKIKDLEAKLGLVILAVEA